MKTLQDVYDELDCISDLLALLCNVASDDYAEGVGRPAGKAFQDAIYAVSLQIAHVRDTVDQISKAQVNPALNGR